MGLLNLLQAATDERPMPTVQGSLRADRRTKNLLPRLKPGDIALIHHADLDATAARALVDAGIGAVVNAAPCISGRYPNGGPTVLIEAGIPVVDRVGDEFFERALKREGSQASIQGADVRVGDGVCATGEMLTAELVERQLEAARGNLGHELEQFARNTLEYLSEEKGILLDPVDVPQLKTPIRARHAMIVVRGEGYKDDLRAIADYLHDVRPVLIGVDGGADALLDEGFRPDIIIGDMDSVSDTALRCGAELVVHGYSRGSRNAPGLTRLESLGLSGHVFHAAGTSEDIAILLADELGASLIVAVGTHFSLVEFLDKGRGGMASTFLTRLRTGSKLVDAKGIGRLWEARLKSRNRTATVEIILLILAALFPLGVIAVYSPLARTLLSTFRLYFRSTFGLH
jgi:uncharacterized membrane-anchored protein